ncbi:MAG: acyl carrier protein [Terriglobia bacterium]
MVEREERLIRCFASVFPTLAAADIPLASPQSVSSWDSLASVTLIAVVQQEFGVEIDLLDLPELSSFAALLAYLDLHSVAVAKREASANQ